MTADHWMQIAIGLINATAVVTAPAVAVVVASRINQPTQKVDTAKPKRKTTRVPPLLRSPWFLPPIIILSSISGLHSVITEIPFTPYSVLAIAGFVFTTGFGLLCIGAFILLRMVTSILEEDAEDAIPSLPTQT